VHFGARGLGHKTAKHFLKATGAPGGMDVEPCVLPIDSDLGAEYFEAMRMAGEYAFAGRAGFAPAWRRSWERRSENSELPLTTEMRDKID